MRPAGNAIAYNRSLPSYQSSVQIPSGQQNPPMATVQDDGWNWARELSPEERTRRLFEGYQRTGNVSQNLWGLGIDRNLFDQLRAQQIAQQTAQVRQLTPGTMPRAMVNPTAPAPTPTAAPVQQSPFTLQRKPNLQPWRRLPSYGNRR